MTNTRARGAGVEAAARDFLLGQGLRAVAANANYRFGELDLVMLDRDTLVFVEVRYRRDASFGGGAASVDAGKRRKLVKAAQAFLLAHRHFTDAPCRFDVVDASGDPASPAFDWLRDAFRADD
ncbi:MAG: YraN family protein [Luteimonas sp.]|nr:YraN family protein [Luteimonas sp.]